MYYFSDLKKNSGEEESAPEQKSDRPSLTVAVSLLSGVVGVVSGMQ